MILGFLSEGELREEPTRGFVHSLKFPRRHSMRQRLLCWYLIEKNSSRELREKGKGVRQGRWKGKYEVVL